MSISTMIMQFCIAFNFGTCDAKVEFVDSLRVIETPYGRRQAHGVAKISENTVVLRLDHWNRINPWQKQELLWHELAHLRGCVYHVDTKPHIMNPHAPNVYWVEPDGSNWPDLIKSLGLYLDNCILT